MPHNRLHTGRFSENLTMNSHLNLVVAYCALSFFGAPANAQEWVRFRGPNGSGVSTATTIPVEWTEEDLNWKIEIPGIGHGSPVVWENRLYINAESNDGEKRIVLCIDTQSGQQIWERSFPAVTHKKHRKNSFASSTPAVDERHVYAAWATPERITLVALDHNGALVWDADLGAFKGGHGFAASPIVYQDMVVIGNDQDGESSLIAVDRSDGSIRWNVPRRSKRITYSTPCVYERAGRAPELIFTNWQHGITAINPDSGNTNWELSTFDTSRNERAIGSPVVAGDLIIGTCGFVTAQKHAVAVRPGDSGQPDDVEEVFRIERNVPHIPTVIVHNDRLYMWSDKGIVGCYELQTGKSIWQQRVGGNFFGSPVCVNDCLYSISDEGEVVVIAADDRFEVLAKNSLGEPSHSTPAVANGAMFLRTFSHLISVGGLPSTDVR